MGLLNRGSRLSLIGAALLGCVAAAPGPGTLPGSFDPNNVLARRARGETPSAKLYEDAHTLAFLIESPSSKGHFLVISKRSTAPNFLAIETDELNRMIAVARKVARAEVIALGADGFMIRQNNGSAASIMEVHFHIIPRWKSVPFDESKKPEPVSVAELQPLADQIKAAMR